MPKLKSIDLFAGCGGLSLGLEQAGFETVFVNELHPDAMKTFLQNRPKTNLADSKNHILDIKSLTRNKDSLQSFGKYIGKEHGEIDLVCGGPPCQGYSGIGHRRTFDLDKREMPTNHLYKDMAKVVTTVAPKMFLFENVRGLLNSKWTPEGEKGEIWNDVQKTFKNITVQIGKQEFQYQIGFKLVFAKEFGVPQNRPRILMVGLRGDIDFKFTNIDSSRGFVPSTTNADSGVGDTLEALLGIRRNSNRAPDYKGIEIKSSRLSSRTGRQENRSTLFSKIPDWEISTLKSARQILDRYGYISSSTGRPALQVTLKHIPNAQGLYLAFNDADSKVENLFRRDDQTEEVVAWKIDGLENSLREKHKNTFWVKANTREINGTEHFHYVQVIATSAPLVSNFSQLVDLGSIQMDYTISEKLKPDGGIKVRDHGYLWKIAPEDIGLLFPPPKVFDLLVT